MNMGLGITNWVPNTHKKGEPMKKMILASAVLFASISNASELSGMDLTNTEITKCPSVIVKAVDKAQDAKALAKTVKNRVSDKIRENTQDIEVIQEIKESYRAVKSDLKEAGSQLKGFANKVENKVDARMDKIQARLKALLNRTETGRDVIEILKEIEADLEREEARMEADLDKTKALIKSCK
jgi:hypothetical protein